VRAWGRIFHARVGGVLLHATGEHGQIRRGMLSGSADALVAIKGVTEAVVLEAGMIRGIPAPGR